MPHQLIQDYNSRHHVNIDANAMTGAVSSILVASKDAEKRDELLKQYLSSRAMRSQSLSNHH